MKFEVAMVFTGPMSILLGRSLVPVSTKFSISALSPKIMYLNPFICSSPCTNELIELSLFVSSTWRYWFQKSSLRIMAFTSFTSFFLPLNSCCGSSSKAKSERRVLRITAIFCNLSITFSSVNMSSVVSTHVLSGSCENSCTIFMLSTQFTSDFFGMVMLQRFT